MVKKKSKPSIQLESSLKTRLTIPQLKREYGSIKQQIQRRLMDFKLIGETENDRDLFLELIFCLFTPQSKAQTCLEAVDALFEEDLLFTADAPTISEIIRCVRFRHTKAKNVVKAREMFFAENSISLTSVVHETADPHLLRVWLVSTIKGIGYKEASHFLRNIGKGDTIAILDRHILRNLHRFNVISEIPQSLTGKKYLTIEQQMQVFSGQVRIPLAHLDLLFWYLETGKILK